MRVASERVHAAMPPPARRGVRRSRDRWSSERLSSHPGMFDDDGATTDQISFPDVRS